MKEYWEDWEDLKVLVETQVSFENEVKIMQLLIDIKKKTPKLPQSILDSLVLMDILSFDNTLLYKPYVYTMKAIWLKYIIQKSLV